MLATTIHSDSRHSILLLQPFYEHRFVRVPTQRRLTQVCCHRQELVLVLGADVWLNLIRGLADDLQDKTGRQAHFQKHMRVCWPGAAAEPAAIPALRGMSWLDACVLTAAHNAVARAALRAAGGVFLQHRLCAARKLLLQQRLPSVHRNGCNPAKKRHRPCSCWGRCSTTVAPPVGALTPVYSRAGLPSTSTVAHPLKQPCWSRPWGVGSKATGTCSQLTRSCDLAWPQTRPHCHSLLLGTCW